MILLNDSIFYGGNYTRHISADLLNVKSNAKQYLFDTISTCWIVHNSSKLLLQIFSEWFSVHVWKISMQLASYKPCRIFSLSLLVEFIFRLRHNFSCLIKQKTTTQLSYLETMVTTLLLNHEQYNHNGHICHLSSVTSVKLQ